MRTARSAKPSQDAPSGPWSEQAGSPVRPATPDDAAAASPVHALQAKIGREWEPARERPKAAEIAVRLVILLYVAGFWWGLAALAATFARHLIR